MLKPLSWKSILMSLVLPSLLGLCVGLVFGEMFRWLACIFFVCLAWHLYQQFKLSSWLWLGKSMMPPRSWGSWETIFYGLQRLQKRNKKRRQALATLLKRIRKGTESLPDAVIIMTKEGIVLWCNHLAQVWLGLRWPYDQGQAVQNLIRYPEFVDYLQKGVFTEPLSLQLHSQRHLEFRFIPYSKTQFLLIARDMTPIKRLEKVRHEFFNNVSHELGTPLTVLKGYLEMAGDGGVHLTMPAIQAMQHQTQRLENLISQLVLLSRMDVGMTNLPKTAIDVSSIVKKIELSMMTHVRKNQNLSFDYPASLIINGHEESLFSALTNLVENAIWHTPEGTTIKVHLGLDNNKMIFSVEDNGPGIAPEHIPRLTERFYRVDSGRHTHSGGSGIGLAIVKHALQQHGTELRIESREGQGSKFYFELIASSVENR